LINQLASLGKKLIVVQLGGGQVDDTALLSNVGVNGVLWAGYPGQEGGSAIYDVITGAQSVAGRLPVTQYPADYVNDVSLFNMNLRPGPGNPGRTYVWYTGNPVLPFGYGLHYANFSVSWAQTPKSSYDIGSLGDGQSKTQPPSNEPLLDWPSFSSVEKTYLDLLPFINISVNVKNTGGKANLPSDYVGLLFISTKNGGPSPYPNKELVSYARLHSIPVGATRQLTFSLTLDNIARTDVSGNRYVYPGDYMLELDYDSTITFDFKLAGTKKLIDAFPTQLSNITAYEYLGCFRSSQQNLSIPAPLPASSSSNYPQLCVNECAKVGYAYSAVQKK
jgi:beta-D-xylosidase 4